MSSINQWLLRWLPLGAVVTVAAFLMGALLLVNDVRRSNSEQAQICRVAERNNQTLRELLQLSQRNARVKLRAFPVRLAATEKFYREAFGLLLPVDCDRL